MAPPKNCLFSISLHNLHRSESLSYRLLDFKNFEHRVSEIVHFFAPLKNLSIFRLRVEFESFKLENAN